MKKMMTIVIALIAAIVLCGCQPKPDTSNTPVDPAQTVAGVMNEFLEKHQDALPAFMEVDAETLDAVYGIPSEWVDAYSCRIPMMNVHATEIFVAHAAEGHLDDVKAAIEARQKALEATWEMYLPAQYELVKSSVTEANGNYVLYAVTEHADSIKEIFNKNIQ